jgi:peptidoglycan/LPS O-acetylase OafA/YrhL
LFTQIQPPRPLYRPEIDGLRALAVGGVVLYHLDLGCPGGYVGVDVFFVISGFLITQLLIDLQSRDSLTLSAFWGRRFRRLFPALAVVVAFTLFAGWSGFFQAIFENTASRWPRKRP